VKAVASFLRKLIPARYRPIGYLQHLAQTRTNRRVRSGPFAGLRYLDDSIGSAYIPKLLGIYESELEAAVESICSRKPDLILDIGAAEGYYAIGLALRNPSARVVAFETNPAGQAALRKMASLNQVSNRVEVRGKCEPTDLAAVLVGTEQPVIICDVEGDEKELLDPVAIPSLARASIMAELHDFIVPGITEVLNARFMPTHNLRHIWQQPRSRAQFPWRTLGTSLLPRSYLDWSVSEWRPVHMAWLWMEPHA
jgi:hypothetical protein